MRNLLVIATAVAVRACAQEAPPPQDPVLVPTRLPTEQTPAQRLPVGQRGVLVPWTGTGRPPGAGARVDVTLPAGTWSDRAVIGATGDGLVVVASPLEALRAGDLWGHADQVGVVVRQAAPEVRWPSGVPGGSSPFDYGD